MAWFVCCWVQTVVLIGHIIHISTSTTLCFTKGTCSCEMSDGSGTIDLSPISNAGKPPRFNGIKQGNNPDFTFQYDPCHAFTNEACKNVFVCQIFKEGISQFDAGKQFSAQVLKPDKVKFIYHSLPVKRTTEVTLVCDPKANTPIIKEFIEPPDRPDHYTTTLTSKYACPVKSLAVKKKISVGTILCILLLVGIVTYFAVGIVLNKYGRSKQGREVIPNVNFWLDCPSLVKDGCIFTYSRFRGRTSEYESI